VVWQQILTGCGFCNVVVTLYPAIFVICVMMHIIAIPIFPTPGHAVRLAHSDQQRSVKPTASVYSNFSRHWNLFLTETQRYEAGPEHPLRLRSLSEERAGEMNFPDLGTNYVGFQRFASLNQYLFPMVGKLEPLFSNVWKEFRVQAQPAFLIEAATKSRKSGCGSTGWLLSSGCACVATYHG